MKLYARWTDDCQGKKDYDGPVIQILTRYWPAGGGMHILKDGEFRQSSDPKIKPAAMCELVISHGEPEDDDGGPNNETLAEERLTGNSFEEVAEQVEKFAQDQMDFVVETLKNAYRTR